MSKILWQPFAGGRHVIWRDLRPGDSGETFCGLELTIPAQRATKMEWLWPTCQRCNQIAKSRI